MIQVLHVAAVVAAILATGALLRIGWDIGPELRSFAVVTVEFIAAAFVLIVAGILYAFVWGLPKLGRVIAHRVKRAFRKARA